MGAVSWGLCEVVEELLPVQSLYQVSKVKCQNPNFTEGETEGPGAIDTRPEAQSWQKQAGMEFICSSSLFLY